MIVGGLSGIGLSVARWIVEHGGRHILITSRNAHSRLEGNSFGRQLAAGPAKVIIKDCDVSSTAHLKRVLQECEAAEMPKVRGVVYGGMVIEVSSKLVSLIQIGEVKNSPPLPPSPSSFHRNPCSVTSKLSLANSAPSPQDAVLEQMSFSQWDRALRPKVSGTKNIHALLGDELDFFIMLSSCCGVLGSPSQANYTAGNTYQDALARHRCSHGLPAVALDLGVVDSIGFVAETQREDVRKRMEKLCGHDALSEAQVLGLVDVAIRNPHRPPNLSQITAGMSGSGDGARNDARFSELRCRTESRLGGAQASGPFRGSGIASGARTLYDQVMQATTLEGACNAVQDGISVKLSELFALGDAKVDPSKSLAHYGVDSLVAVELRNWLVPSARVEMSIFELLGNTSLGDLAMKVVQKVRPVF